jgi:hypothetical protein
VIESGVARMLAAYRHQRPGKTNAFALRYAFFDYPGLTPLTPSRILPRGFFRISMRGFLRVRRTRGGAISASSSFWNITHV